MYPTKISLILSTFNRSQQLSQCLRKLPESEILRFNIELIIADNSSTDNTRAVIEAFRRESSIAFKLAIASQKGSGHNRNAALKIASGEILVFIDDDCYLAKDYFEILLSAYSKYGGKINFFCGKILLYDSTDSRYGCVNINHFFLIHEKSFIPTGMVQGSNMVITRQVLDVIGIFDPNLGAGTRFRFDDIDYVARASLAGFRGAYIPGLVVFHHHGRKPHSQELANTIRGNNVRCGSYYAKLILLGEYGVLRVWFRQFGKRVFQKSFWHELEGAFLFFIHCILTRTWPRLKIA